MIKQPLQDRLLYTSYVLCFLYLIFQDPIYTPDTSSYLQGSIWRSAGYPSFLFVFKFIFGSFFNLSVVAFQLIISFTALHLFSSKISQLLSLPSLLKYGVVALLIFPLFPPLYIANNICSEGLSYPLYLFVLYFGLHFISNNKCFWQLFIFCILLTLTRGQFIVVPIIIAFIYGYNYRKTLLHKSRSVKIIVLVLVIFTTPLLDKTFHKITRDLFISTPFTYINTSAAALYVSQAVDAESIDNEDYKAIFKDCYAFITKNGWVLSPEKRKSYKTHYLHFHKNLSNICNYTLHNRATAYYEARGFEYDHARAKSEQAAKAIFSVLVKNNWSSYFTLYYENLIHGFKSAFLLWATLLIYLICFYRMLRIKKREYIISFFLLSLILSNAIVVSFASHSIMRYLFYNYSILLVAYFQFFKSIYSDRQT